MESLRHDSAVTLIRKDLLKNDLEREQKEIYAFTGTDE